MFRFNSPVTEPMVKICVTGWSLGHETWTHYIEPQTNSLCNGVVQLIVGRRSFRLTLQQGKSWLCFFFFLGGGDTERVILVYSVPHCHAIVLDMHIQTLKTLQMHFRTVRPHINHLKTKRRPLYLKIQSVPRCKHFSSRLQKPISLCCKWHKSLFVLKD